MLEQPTIENIFLQGGSVKGTAYVGAFQALRNHADMSKVKRMAGTSAGAIGASLLAIGYSIDELENALGNLVFDSFLDGIDKELILTLKDKPTKAGIVSTLFSKPSNASGSASRLATAFGLFEGEVCRQWVEKKITCKIMGISEQEYELKGPHYLTFGELHELVEKNPATFKDLYLMTVNANTEEAEILSYETKPNAIISDAVRCSMSIPLVYKPCHLYEKTRTGLRQPIDENVIYVDGGITDNFRADLFDFARYIDEVVDKTITHKIFNPHTLGFKLASKENKDYYENVTPAQKNDIKKFLPFIVAMLKIMHNKQNVDFMHANDLQRTIIIDTLGVDTLDFNLTDEKKSELIESGRKAVEEYFATRSLKISVPTTLIVEARLFTKILPFFEKISIETEGNEVKLSNFTFNTAQSEQLKKILTEDGSNEASSLITALGLQQDEPVVEPAATLGM